MHEVLRDQIQPSKFKDWIGFFQRLMDWMASHWVKQKAVLRLVQNRNLLWTSGPGQERRACFRQAPLPLGLGQGLPGTSLTHADREIPDWQVKMTSQGGEAENAITLGP